MIGTVMMSSSQQQHHQTNQQQQNTETSNLSKQQINTISQQVVTGQQEYISDTDMSERGGPRSNRSNSQFNRNKNGQYVLSGNNLSYDQQSISSQTTAKMLSSRLNQNSSSNNNQMRQQTSSKMNYSSNNNNVSSATLTSRKMSERSVNFDEENYSKIKSNQELQPQQRTRSKQRGGESNHYGGGGGGGGHYGNGEQSDHYESNLGKQQIQVQILPQDDNWGENTTAFTADFSDFNDDMTEDGRSSHHFNGRIGSGRNNKHDNANSQNVFIDIDEKQLAYGSGACGSLRMCRTYCSSYFGFFCAFFVSFCAFLTPVMFIILPRLNLNQQWQVTECGLECEGLLIGIAFKMFVLLLGSWALFLRKPRYSLPRIYELRALLIFLMCIMTFSYWLFYAVRIIDTHTQDYHKILQFAVSYVDVLLFIFIISVFILELRQVQPEYVVKIVRSPDGEQSEYLIGKMSIQRAAVWLLEQYYKDFNAYNPWLENAHKKRGAQLLQLEQQASSGGNNKKSRSRSGSVANFNPDKDMDNEDDRESRIMSSKKMPSSSRSNLTTTGGNMNANDRFYEEYEYERRLRKRRARLMTSTEEAFTHIKRMTSEMTQPSESTNTSTCTDNTNIKAAAAAATLMDPFEAAQAVFTSIARDLRRYLRVTRQQPFFTRDSILAHLANCLSYDMSPKSFLQRYLSSEPLIFNERALVSASAMQQQKLSAVLSNGGGSNGVNYNLNLKTIDQSWILISDTALYQNIEDNLMLVLKQNEVSLMCTFKRLPRFNLIEDILDPKRNKFVLKLNSETTV